MKIFNIVTDRLAQKFAALVVMLPLALGAAGGIAAAGPDESAQHRGQERQETIDDRFARIADLVPDFGGMFIDEDGVVNVFIRKANSQKAGAVKKALDTEFGDQKAPQGAVKVLEGKFNFRQLKQWHDKVSMDVLTLPGVTMTDIDDRLNRITVGVADSSLASEMQKRVVELGIPADSIVVEETEPFDLQLRSRRRPMVGGLQIVRQIDATTVGICTGGVTGVHAQAMGFLTNSHCTAGTSCGLNGTVFHQPTISTTTVTNRVGVETADPACFSGSTCPSGRVCRYSDAAFVRKDSTVQMRNGIIARPALNSTAWNGTDVYRVIAEKSPFVGQDVQKVGRTTGRTTGSVTATCVNVNQTVLLASGATQDTGRTMLCQAVANYASGPGDSGSPVFSRCRLLNLVEVCNVAGRTPTGNDVDFVGINWGGNGTTAVFSPISGIERDLGDVMVTSAEGPQ